MVSRTLIFISAMVVMSTVLTAFPAMAWDMKERDYQENFCDGIGVMEYRLEDGTRVDCLTETHAWEIDFQEKWAESVGQALHYARMTGKRAGVLLIGDNADRYAERIRLLSRRFGLEIDVLTMKP